MPRKPSPTTLEDPAIVERHAAVVGEVVLFRHAGPGLFGIDLIIPKPAGGFDRRTLLLIEGTKARAARRMMDMHACVCAAQHAASA